MDNFILIMGCGHSGTTILNKILSSHISVYGLNYETNMFLNDIDNAKKNDKNIC